MPIQFEIINKSESPPGGWHWRQPESGREFRHYAYQPFLDAIRDHRLGNEFPISADWIKEIENDLCASHPEWGNKICRRVNVQSSNRRLSFAATLSFLQMLTKWVMEGRPYVSQEVAEERAAICATCPNNIPSQFSCGLCVSQIQKVMNIFDKRSTALDAQLDTCGICSCNLRAAVHFPVESQKRSLTPEMVTELKALPFCWKGRELA